MENKIIYPKQPPLEPGKNILEEKPDRLDSQLGLWLTHDPAIYKEPSVGELLHLLYRCNLPEIHRSHSLGYGWKSCGETATGIYGLGWR